MGMMFCFVFFFFKQKPAYEIRLILVGSGMCIGDRCVCGCVCVCVCVRVCVCVCLGVVVRDYVLELAGHCNSGRVCLSTWLLGCVLASLSALNHH